VKKEKKILQDHIKKGKKFVPPLKSKINLHESDYATDILPEIIWICIILEDMGNEKGMEFAHRFSQLANQTLGNGDYYNFSISSHLYRLSEEQKNDLINKLIENEMYFVLSDILAPIVYFYKESPFSFLAKEIDIVETEKNELLNKLKNILFNCFDRFKQKSVIAMYATLYIDIKDKKIHFPSDMKLPDFNSIFGDMETEEAKHASAFIRNNLKTKFMSLEDRGQHEGHWTKSFWNQSYSLDSCEI
jgi:hypothetical protein